jgi:hypothetical protein
MINENIILYRKISLEEKILNLNNSEISLEGFFDFLFSDNKSKIKSEHIKIEELIKEIENNKDDFKIEISCYFNNSDKYIHSLEDLNTKVLPIIDKNIIRVTSFLKTFNGLNTNLEKIRKIGEFKDSKIINNRKVIKTNYFIAPISISNHFDYTDFSSNSQVKKLFECAESLEDIDFFYNINNDSKELIKNILDKSKHLKLINVLTQIDKNIKNMQKNVTELKNLFVEKDNEFKKELINSGLEKSMVMDSEYLGFGGSMHQGLGYLYEVEKGFEKDIIKTIKVI